MYIPINEFFNIDLWALAPFIFGIPGGESREEQPPTPPPPITSPPFTPVPSGEPGRFEPTPIPAVSSTFPEFGGPIGVAEQARQAAAVGNYDEAANLYGVAHEQAGLIDFGNDRTRRAELQTEADRLRNRMTSSQTEARNQKTAFLSFQTEQEKVAAQRQSIISENEQIRLRAEAQASQARIAALQPKAQEQSLQALIAGVQPSATELAIQEMTLAELQRARERGVGTPSASIMAQINPAIQANIFENIRGNIDRESAEARKLILGDIAGRNLTGSGIEQSALARLRERTEQRLDEADRFAATKSAELGLSNADLALQAEQIRGAASQFNIGIGAEIDRIGQQRAITRFGTLAGIRESGLDRSLLAAQTRGSQALQQRGQDVSIFETLSQRAAENRKKKESLLGNLAGGIGSAAGSALGLGGGLAIGSRFGGSN